jgi:chemosensory pili system protein ChpA (sensor histidine kinase/response regulator)
MRLQDDIDFTTLTWVKGELDETLKQARLALEAFVEDPDDASQMRFCATYLHQVQGTLRMVELYGAAMVTEEMEHLASALQNRQVSGLDEAYAVLMRGIVQLPDYLERLQSGHKDIPIVLLPLLNDLRAARGEKGLPESALFAPDLSQPLPASAQGPAVPVPELELRQIGAVARSQFQIALLRWFKGQDVDANLERMLEVCDRLVATITQEEGRRLFWVAGTVLFGVRSGEIEASPQLKQTVGRVEREIKHLADAGDTGFRVDPPRELTRNLLYFIAHGRASSDRLVEVRNAFRLDMFVPTAEEFEDARRSISGHNRALLDTVAGAIREDLLRVKDALDLYLRKADSQASELSGQVDVLDRVGDTLGMLGLGVPRRVVMEQRDVVALVAQGQRPADESTLLDIAGALLYVEATLDDQVQQLGGTQAAPVGNETLPRAEARKVLEAVIKEAQSNFAQSKQCYVAFVESNWDHAQLADVQRLLGEVGGAMRILDLPEAASLLEAVARFTTVELVQHRRVPNGQQMDTLADALASLEYFIESVRDQRGERGKILDLARERLTSLGYWPVPDHALASPEAEIPVAASETPRFERAPEPAVSSERARSEQASHDDQAGSGLVLDSGVPEHPQVPDLASLGAVEVAPGVDLGDLIVGETASEALNPAREVHELAGFKPVETESTRPPVAGGKELSGFQMGTEDIDEEIREVFVEEVQEEIDNLRQLLPVWQGKPEDFEALKPIRRVFHTLKGSGRLVGAVVLGEFAWKIENLLNRVLDNTIPPRPEVLALVAEARDILPELLCALRGEPGRYADLSGVQEAADALAAGQIVEYRRAELDQTSDIEPAAVAEERVDVAALGDPVAADEGAAEAVEGLGADDEHELITLSESDSAAIDALLAGAASSADVGNEYRADTGLEAASSLDLASGVAGTLDTRTEPVIESLADAGSEELPTFAVDGLDEIQSEEVIELPVPELQTPDQAESAALDLGFEWTETEMPGVVEDTLEEAGDLVLIDSDLFEILKAEVAGHLDTVEVYLQQSSVQPLPVHESLLRAVHTISGAFAMTEVEVGTELAWPLEGYIKRLLAQSAAPSMVGFECIEEAAQALRALMIELDQPLPRPQRHSRLALRISALRDALPEPTRPVIDVGVEDEAALPAVGAMLSADEFALAQPVPDVVRGDAPLQAGLPESAMPESAERTDEPLTARDPLGLLPSDSEFDLLAASGELSFASEFESAEPFDPEAQAQSANIEIIETEGASTSPFWTDTGSLSVQPGVDSGLTLDELGEASEAEAWLAAFEAEVAGEPDKTSLAASSQVEAELAGQAESDDALLIHGLLETPSADLDLGDGTAETAELPIETETLASSLVENLLPAEESLEPAAEGDEQALDAVAIEYRAPLAPTDAGSGDSETIESLEATEISIEDASRFAEVERAVSGFEQPGLDTGADVSAMAYAGSELETPERAQDIERLSLETETVEVEAIELEPEAERIDSVSDARFEEQGFEAEGYPEHLLADVESSDPDAADASLMAEERESEPTSTAEDGLESELALPVDAASAAPGGAAEFEPETRDAASTERADADGAAAAAAPAQTALKLAIPKDLDPDGPLDVTDVDVDLLDVFLEEGVDILDHSDGLMARLREAPQDRELVVGLQRDLHTLKGGARMAGLAPIGDLAHATESLLEGVAAGGRDLDGVGVEVLERAFDRLHSLVSRVGERRAIEAPIHLLGAVEALLRGESLPVEGAPVVGAVDVPAAARLETAEPARKLPPPIRSIPSETALDEEEGITRAPQEQIRIRADLLDRLVNYAGEVAIYRARLEQQLGAFRGNLGELDQTTTRLRDQLRKLEIETEAQILSRYQRQQDEGDTQFDPLELDRFSTLQQLSRALSESAADIINLQHTLEDLTRQYETLLLQQSRVSSDLQEGLMRTRMVPFDSLVPRLRRILRQTAGELGKQAQLKVEGAQGEMDRNVLDRMTAPLEHMLRNALAHGLETPADRGAAGKAAEGTIRIQVAREASEVLIRVSDDGRGLDREAIRRKAIERGLMKPDAQLGDRDLYGFILESGFSTAASVSKIAGRGVGMDVVYSEIRQLGGSLHIESEQGRGTEFVIRLPFTLAVTQAVFVKQGETSYAIPITSVQGVSRIDREELDKQLASGSPVFAYAGEEYVIHDLGLLLGQPAARAADSLQVPVLLARSGDQRAAICVDNVLGSREIVVKPTGPQVSSIPGIFGATIMGDGRVVVILDVAPLVRRAAAVELVPVAVEPEDLRVVPLVMVVDDSITMRKVTGRVLERHNFEVLTAKDGVDAIEKLAERVPDVMLLDIEMPRMDGYELATHMRNDPRLKGVPIIMITSRTGDKHRQRAFEIGVDRYLGKPYQEADLMRNVMEILQVRRERGR